MCGRLCLTPYSSLIPRPEHQKLITLLDRLVDEVGENESHPLASLMEI
jgi:hypothetical protein